MMPDQPRLVLSEAPDRSLYYGLTHTAALPRSDVDALKPQQRAYLESACRKSPRHSRTFCRDC